MVFLKAVSVERFFTLFGRKSHIFGLKWESYSVPRKTANWSRIESGSVSSIIQSHVI